MNHQWFRYVACFLTALLIGMALAACGAKSESGTRACSTRNVLGTYESVDLGVVIKLESDNKATITESDNKVTMVDEGQSTEVPWKMSGDKQLVVHVKEGMTITYNINPDGSLSDAMDLGSVYRKQ